MSVWIGIGGAMGAFLTLVAGLRIYARSAAPRPDVTRKLLHLGSGLLTLAFPFLFGDLWPVLLLTGATTALLALVKFHPWCRRRLGAIVGAGGRTTFGELYFPIAVAAVFWLARAESPLLFVVPILVLTVADAAGAVVGFRYGMHRYFNATKTLEGSAAVAVATFICTAVPLHAWGGVGMAESLLIGQVLALVVALLEASAWRGLDNLFVPIGGYFVLRALMPLDVEMLVVRLFGTIGLTIVLLLAQQRVIVVDHFPGRVCVRLSIAAWALFLAMELSQS